MNDDAGWWYEDRMLMDSAVEQFAGIGGPDDEKEKE